MNNQGLGHQGARHLAEALLKGIKDSNGKGLKLTHFSAGRNRLENVGACLLAEVFSQMQSLEEVSTVLHLHYFLKYSSISIKTESAFTVLKVSERLFPPLPRILICAY